MPTQGQISHIQTIAKVQHTGGKLRKNTLANRHLDFELCTVCTGSSSERQQKSVCDTGGVSRHLCVFIYAAEGEQIKVRSNHFNIFIH